MQYVTRVENGRVMEAPIAIPDDKAIEDCFHPDIATLMKICTSDIYEGQTWNSETGYGSPKVEE